MRRGPLKRFAFLLFCFFAAGCFASTPNPPSRIARGEGKLEFKLVDDSLSDSELRALVEKTRTQNKLPESYGADVVSQLNRSLQGKIPADTELAYELRYDESNDKIAEAIPLLVKQTAALTGDMLSDAHVSVISNEPYVSLTFNAEGSKIFLDLTTQNVGKRLAIVLDDVVHLAPVIKSPIPSGEAQITMGVGDYRDVMRRAEDLVQILTKRYRLKRERGLLDKIFN